MYIFYAEPDEKQRIYYWEQYGGIWEYIKRKSGYADKRCICPKGTENFFVYEDKEGTVHLITNDEESNLLYMLCRSGQWRTHVVCSVRKNIKIKKIMLGINKFGENLFFSAEFGGENILVHCVMGNNAKPSVIGRMCSEEFFVYKNAVYYSNSDGILGFQSFSDGKPDRFMQCCEGVEPYLFEYASKEYLIYRNNNNIYVNDKKCAADIRVKQPVAVSGDCGMMLMWQSGDFVRYIPFESDCRRNKITQYVSAGRKPNILVMSDGYETGYRYGIFTGKEIKFF